MIESTIDEPKNVGGRPLKFKTVEELQDKIDEYMSIVPQEEWTITGLADHLDTFRSVLCDYEEKDGFSYTIKKAKQKVEMAYEKSLRKNGRSGDIFALKNFGWKDKNETDVTSGGDKLSTVVIELVRAKKSEDPNPGSL